MFPSYIRIKSVEWASAQNVVSSESRNNITLSRTLPGHRWEARFSVQVRPFETRPARGWLFALQVDDANETYSDPDWETSITGRTVATAALKGEKDISINDETDIEPGMMLNFAGHPKLYMVRAVAVGQITIFPELHEDVALGEALVLDQPTATLELPPEIKRSASVSSQLERDPSSINLRMWEVRR